VQALLRGDGAVITVLRGFRAGTPELMPWARLCAQLARHAVGMFSCEPAPAQASTDLTRQLVAVMLAAAGQACPLPHFSKSYWNPYSDVSRLQTLPEPRIVLPP